MARIIISSTGTMGDFVPFVALGRRLQARGHQIGMAVNPAMFPLAERAGLEPLPCGNRFGPAEARQRAAVFDYWSRFSDDEIRDQWRYLDLDRSYFDLAEACRGADLLIASSLQGAAPMVHEKTGIPWATVSLLPREYPHADDPEATLDEKGPSLTLEFLDHLNRLRENCEFPHLSLQGWARYNFSKRRVLLASSPHFSQPILEASPQVRMTGFWFADHPSGWSPDDELLAFLDVDPKPLVLTFSSLPVQDATRVLAQHVEAAERLDRRLLIQRGWAQFDRRAAEVPASPGRLLFVDALPHAWLFPRASAVIHHGGVGTTAQAMRCGCPMLVEPYGNDQFFNARRVLALGVGAAAHPHKITAEGLARILDERILKTDVQERARELAARLQAEDGLKAACDQIDEFLCPHRWRESRLTPAP